MDKVLVVTAVEQEQDAVKRGLGADPRFDVVAGGVGLAEAAVSTAFSLSEKAYSAVISIGIGGGFEQTQVNVESIVVASDIFAADLGSETNSGFLSLEELDLGVSKYSCNDTYVEELRRHIAASGIEVQTGPILTTTTTTGTAKKLTSYYKEYPTPKRKQWKGLVQRQLLIESAYLCMKYELFLTQLVRVTEITGK
nr:futalosine hydrolase [Salibacterium salarium]